MPIDGNGKSLTDAFPSYKPPWPVQEFPPKFDTLKGPSFTPPSPHQAVAIPHAVLLAPSVGQTLGTPVQHIFLGGGAWALNLHPILKKNGEYLLIFLPLRIIYLLDFSWLKCLLDFTSLDLRNFAHVAVLYRDLFTYFLTYPQCWSCQKHERWGGGVPFSICRCGSVSKPCTPGEHKNSW